MIVALMFDRDVSTARCRSSSGDSVDLLSRTTFVPPWLLVSCVSRTSLMVGGFRSKALMVLSEEETGPSAVRCGGDRLLMSVGLSASTLQESQFHFSVDVVRVKSYVNSLFNSIRVPVQVSVNRLNFVPERIMPGLTGVFRNCRSLSS